MVTGPILKKFCNFSFFVKNSVNNVTTAKSYYRILIGRNILYRNMSTVYYYTMSCLVLKPY